LLLVALLVSLFVLLLGVALSAVALEELPFPVTFLATLLATVNKNRFFVLLAVEW